MVQRLGAGQPDRETDHTLEPHHIELTMGRMHYVDEGKGEPLVMIHGNPSWSFEWEREPGLGKATR